MLSVLLKKVPQRSRLCVGDMDDSWRTKHPFLEQGRLGNSLTPDRSNAAADATVRGNCNDRAESPDRCKDGSMPRASKYSIESQLFPVSLLYSEPI